jgi:PHD/YefM family antitoxin component YafN of YafNO toxin-antitoxin module
MFDMPTVSITDVKKSPVEIFELASRNKNAVYVSNRASVAGVMLTKSQYEDMQAQIETLQDILTDTIAIKRLQEKAGKRYTDAEVRGACAIAAIDENDGWE